VGIDIDAEGRVFLPAIPEPPQVSPSVTAELLAVGAGVEG
jgi:hypothetical protein